MTTAPTELDPDTRSRLADEVERLVRMGMDRKKARRVVWDDYLDERAADVTPPPEPEPVQVAPPVTAPSPATRRPIPEAQAEQFFTPERLQRNRGELARIKQLVGLRNRKT
ncbi:hypothetical protein NH8B_2081 [Pseudogulbenkiania sp. NH8B]|uniref:hypothetical protein n=1 Tax=Pseudogulbenkiania sp. (strain NH8B) TaxID=748280 RepID=UPI0002279B3E|nr:hypothetical protein [Pseudogulbenkiania sp. NH8B]BAK76467.1 hypothetical protein NH8B_1650 [Pseudogulbenkiania sp. NH8B]BAK76896.1 hypothetical protein NH8B_2081 [Pseudogulbenkiania sp. NH8B]